LHLNQCHISIIVIITAKIIANAIGYKGDNTHHHAKEIELVSFNTINNSPAPLKKGIFTSY